MEVKEKKNAEHTILQLAWKRSDDYIVKVTFSEFGWGYFPVTRNRVEIKTGSNVAFL